MLIRRLAAVIALALAPHAALAQSTDPLDSATVRIGPLGINPTLTVHDIGRDENVFNDPVNPQSDFTMTVSPKATVLFRPRIVHLTYTTATDYVYFKKFKDQRSTNQLSGVRADFDLARFQPYVGIQGTTSRERYNQEVDARAKHRETTENAGIGLRVATRTTVSVGVRRTDLSFDPGTTFRGADLSRSFDSRLNAVDTSFGVDLTPFTNLRLVVSEEEQRFTFARERDSRSYRITPTVTFSPDALLKGSLAIGYRRFTPKSSELPGYSGLVATVNLGTVILGRHRLDGVFTRDLRYSYDEATPYYLTTGGTVTMTSEIFGPVDVRLSGSRQLLDYRSLGQAAGTGPGNDTVTGYGFGVGYRLRDRVRLGGNADWSQRDSELSANRAFRNRRIYASVTWGAQ
jgi:putative beta-barrel porin BBP2